MPDEHTAASPAQSVERSRCVETEGIEYLVESGLQLNALARAKSPVHLKAMNSRDIRSEQPTTESSLDGEGEGARNTP
jgi:hypothetical protein